MTACWMCDKMSSCEPTPAVAEMTCSPSGNIVHLCRGHLNNWLDDVDLEWGNEPAALRFLTVRVAPWITCPVCGDPACLTVHGADGEPTDLETCHCGWIALEHYANVASTRPERAAP